MTMYWEEDKCPECGEPPVGTVESLQGLAQLEPEEEGGGFTYGGDTPGGGGGARTPRDEDGRDSPPCEKRPTSATGSSPLGTLQPRRQSCRKS